jgi:hypothetical protein
MKNWIGILMLSLAIVSCGDKEYTEDKFGREFLEILIAGDTIAYKRLSLTIADSSQLLDSSGLKKINYWRDYPEEIRLNELSLRKHFVDWTEKAKELDILHNAKYLRTEIDAQEWVATPFGLGDDAKISSWKSYPFFKIFLLSDTNEYYFIVHDVIKVHGGWKHDGISPITNDEIERTIRENTPFSPNRLRFTEYRWRLNDCTTFNDFYVKLSNKTDTDFDYVKYKMVIRAPDDRVIYSKTSEIYGKVFVGDVMSHEVTELRNYYAGENLCGVEDLNVYLNVLDVKPKPLN